LLVFSLPPLFILLTLQTVILPFLTPFFFIDDGTNKRAKSEDLVLFDLTDTHGAMHQDANFELSEAELEDLNTVPAKVDNDTISPSKTGHAVKNARSSY
jgi:hypothetical protein